MSVALVLGLVLAAPLRAATHFEITFPAWVHATPITGRLFLILATKEGTEPRLQQPLELLGADVARG
jgi:hypothetical protein